MLRFSLALLLVPFVFGCSKVETASSSSSQPATTEVVWDTFGAELSGDAETVPVSSLLADPDRYSGQHVRISGSVDTVCKKKGCWMTMSEGDESVRVTFLDYGFFVPVDSEGRELVLDGTFEVTTVPEAEVKHLLEDEGKHAEAAAHQGDVDEYRIVATGVRMQPGT